MYIYICILYICNYICIYIYIHVHISLHKCMHIYIYSRVYIYIDRYTTHTHTFKHKNTNAHTHIHTHTHTHIPPTQTGLLRTLLGPFFLSASLVSDALGELLELNSNSGTPLDLGEGGSLHGWIAGAVENLGIEISSTRSKAETHRTLCASENSQKSDSYSIYCV